MMIELVYFLGIVIIVMGGIFVAGYQKKEIDAVNVEFIIMFAFCWPAWALLLPFALLGYCVYYGGKYARSRIDGY